ncbi:MAG TPA: SUMF1/EgtB/PvdO family nonheme iron enzyme [Catalimonadaceae bacterium]|nr:SUMF1/EgtB/PvdO family nonheme iron enzyme [Catalimonadaceae bacterium]HPI10968.1 SUMF1/EgtB/PvdO family nonheme iron enzyme [Catalimonadaceae bacterium]
MKHFFCTLLFLSLFATTHANNISITNVTLTGQNVAAGTNNAANYNLIQFTVSWENSHRVSFGPNNWDAAWLFVKYRVSGGAWSHARLNSTGHIAPTGTTISTGLASPAVAFNATTNPGLGVFLYRSAAGTGTLTATNVQLRWNYGANGVADNSIVEVQVYGIEMIYVPLGAFNAGGSGGTNAFTSTTISTGTPTVAPTGTGTLGGAAGGYPTGQTAPTSTSWPNGYNAFYSMKYEISQQQYVDFLNNLTTTQASARYFATTGSRMGISVAAGVYSTSAPSVAAAYISWADLASYLDWSGLRPMTELEYEKACRGTLAAVANECAWGTTTATAATGVTNAGLANEVASNAGANVCYNSSYTAGPVRVGMFAGAATTRAQAGATFYGIMEMTGNIWERAISMSNAEGRSFAGTHGDGTLATTGEANVTSWPANTTAVGTRLKGGSFNSTLTYLNVSDRLDLADLSSRAVNYGGRGIRTAP